MIGWPSSVATLRLLPVPTPDRDLSEPLASTGDVRNVPVCITCDREGRTCENTPLNENLVMFQCSLHGAQSEEHMEHTLYKLVCYEFARLHFMGQRMRIRGTLINYYVGNVLCNI